MWIGVREMINAMLQTVFDQSLRQDRMLSRLYSYVRRLIILRYDPLVQYQLNGHLITLKLSHRLPIYLKQYPTYSRNLERLARFIRTSFGRLSMIDVGANIGDSYCLASGAQSDTFLLIEGDAHFFDLLKKNTQHDPCVTRVKALISNISSRGNETLVSTGGTAQLVKQDKYQAMVIYYRLDQLLEEYPEFRSSNLLKTDVDGFDCRVLMGAYGFLSETRPVIFFEHHPQLLAQSGEDDMYIFAELANLEYSICCFYDNVGLLLGVVSTSDIERLQDLMRYARSKSWFYYDICCINDRHSDARMQFLNSERQFQASLAL